MTKRRPNKQAQVERNKRAKGERNKRKRQGKRPTGMRPPAEEFALTLRNAPDVPPMTFAANSYVTLNKLSFLNSLVVPVLVNDGTTIRCAGSAFNIAPDGLWVTARHVLDAALEAVGDNPGAYIFLLWVDPHEGELVAHGEGEQQVQHPHRRAATIPVTGRSKDDVNFSDIALLRAGMLNDDGTRHEFPVCRLSARVPKTGIPVAAFGYPRFDVSSDATSEQLHATAFEHNFAVSTGRVLEVYTEGRNTFRDPWDENYRGKLPTACFETSARFEPGMSGGPVMDGDGAICGIVSIGIDESGETSSDNSFASATPVLFTLPAVLDNDDIHETAVTVNRLLQMGAIPCDGYFEQLTIIEQDSGGQVISYPCEDDDEAPSVRASRAIK